MNTLRIILSAVAATVIFPGCYTQFVMVDQAPPQPKEQISYQIDSATGDTVKVVKQTDTVHTRDNQTCIWQRDLMGYPRLYCYDSFYPRDWLYYNYSPWWYDEYPYYSGGYYYGGRRHYTHSYEQENGSSGSTSRSEPAGASGSAYRARTRGIPDQNAQPLSGQSSSTVSPTTERSATVQPNTPAHGQIIIPSSNEQAPRITRERSAGVPSTGNAVPSQTPTSGGSRSAASSSAPPPPPPPQIQSGGSTQSAPPASQPSRNSNDSGNHRRNPRSW